MKNNMNCKIISVALAIIMIATIFTACGKKTNENLNKNDQTVNNSVSQNESLNADEQVGETNSVANGDSEAEANEQNELNSTSVTNNGIVSTTLANSVITSTTKQNSNVTTTKPNGNSGTKPVTTTTTTTTKPTVTTCNHDYSNKTYDYNKYVNGHRSQTCTKCGEVLRTDCEFNPYDYMGSQAEYMRLFNLVNKARREAGLNEVEYLYEFQNGSDIRAREINEVYSHTRPNGQSNSTVYNLDRTIYGAAGENIVGSCVQSPESAFGSWMNSKGHRDNILHPFATGFVCSSCNGHWTMTMFIVHAY